MMGFDGFGSGMGFGGLGMIAFWVLAIGGAIVVMRLLGGFGSAGAPQIVDRAPLEILRERYAKGEIDQREWDRQRRDLEVN